MTTVKLGDVVEITSGFAFPSSGFSTEEGIPLVRIRDVTRGVSETRYVGPFDEDFVVNDGDLLVGMDGEFNAALWRGGRALLNQRVCRLIPDPSRLDFGFLRHVLPRELKAIEDRTPFVTVKHLSVKDIRAIVLALPPLAEQRRIATILDKADRLRRKRQDAIRLADEFLRAVFIDMFGSTDRSSKWPRSSVAEMVASIESGWSAPSSDLDLTEQDLAVLKVSAVSTGWFLPNEAKVVDRSIVDRPLVFPRRGDLLFSRANTRELVAACCLVEEDVENRFLPDKLWRITAEPKRATNEYLCYLFRHPAFRHELTKQATGTSGSMLNISQAKLLSTSAPMPPIALQEKFSKIVQRSLEGRRNSLHSLRDLESLKDSLTAELLS